MTDAEKPTRKFMYWIHTKSWPSISIAFAGFTLFNVILFLPYNANNDAYSWTKKQNVVYTFFSNLSYALGIACMVQMLLLGKFKAISSLLGCDIMVWLSKLVFSQFMVYPIVIFLCYASAQPFYLSLVPVVYALLQHIVMSTLLAFGVYMLVEAPFSGLRSYLTSKIKEGL